MNKILLILHCLSAALLVTGCSPGAEVRQMSGATWGTTYHITYTSARSLTDSVLAQMTMIDSTLSMFRVDSEVSRINADSLPRPVSTRFRDVFNISRRVNALSGRAFDPTVAPLVDIWGFGRKGDSVPPPDPETVSRILERVGIGDCFISGSGELHKKHPLTEFDFSAVAKGYGVDCIAACFTRARVQNYMIEIGGEIALAGKNPRGEPWHIQIDAPVASGTNSHERLTVLTLTDCCIATSGNYRRWRDTGKGRIGHTISPVSGLPAKTSTLSATVIAPTCALADALATACMALPSDRALAMIENTGNTSAMLVTVSDSPESPFVILHTSKWPGK